MHNQTLSQHMLLMHALQYTCIAKGCVRHMHGQLDSHTNAYDQWRKSYGCEIQVFIMHMQHAYEGVCTCNRSLQNSRQLQLRDHTSNRKRADACGSCANVYVTDQA